MTLAGRGVNDLPEGVRCAAAYVGFRDLVLTTHPEIVMYHTIARRAFEVGDTAGALVWYQLLSEAGALVATQNAADLWAGFGEGKAGAHVAAVPCYGEDGKENSARNCSLLYHRRAAALGAVEAMVFLARAEKDRNGSAAFEWANKAAEHGSAQGVFERAMLLYDGIGTEQDRLAAMADLWRLWKEGDAPAQAAAALMIVKLWLVDWWSEVTRAVSIRGFITTAVGVGIGAAVGFKIWDCLV